MYTILLIMTDGQINDMNLTKDLIVAGSYLPLSVIIVGVGNSNFSNMKELDSDGKVLHDSKLFPAERDIVQFVEFR